MADNEEPKTEAEELWGALAQMQMAFNRQAVMVRVAFNLLQSMGFTENILNKIFQLEAAKLLGATGPEDAAEVLAGRTQEMEYLLGEPLTPEKVQEILGFFRAEQRVAGAALKEQEENSHHPEKAVIFGGKG